MDPQCTLVFIKFKYSIKLNGRCYLLRHSFQIHTDSCIIQIFLDVERRPEDRGYSVKTFSAKIKGEKNAFLKNTQWYPKNQNVGLKLLLTREGGGGQYKCCAKKIGHKMWWLKCKYRTYKINVHYEKLDKPFTTCSEHQDRYKCYGPLFLDPTLKLTWIPHIS